jgi:hypothetical protein
MNFVCEECTAIKANGAGFACAYFGAHEPISPSTGSCNYYSPGPRGTEAMPFLGNFTKQELGYVENATGFGCRRCEYWAMAKRDCSKIDKNSAGDTPGEISKDACCSQQQTDSWRGKLDARELSDLIRLTDIRAAHLTADEYRRLHELGG